MKNYSNIFLFRKRARGTAVFLFLPFSRYGTSVRGKPRARSSLNDLLSNRDQQRLCLTAPLEKRITKKKKTKNQTPNPKRKTSVRRYICTRAWCGENIKTVQQREITRVSGPRKIDVFAIFVSVFRNRRWWRLEKYVSRKYL